MPVVSTPIVYLRDYPDLANTGGTADELAGAVRQALEEPADSPKKMNRVAKLREHSIDTMAQILRAAARGHARISTPGLGEPAIDTNASPLKTLRSCVHCESDPFDSTTRPRMRFTHFPGQEWTLCSSVGNFVARSLP
jgi:hypothetical protein